MNILGWSGTPLLAGFNAGAYYPLELLYLILPTQAATLAFISLLQLTFAMGLRRLGRSMGYLCFAVDLVSLSAPALSYFYAQTIHLDMASGIAVIPWALVAIYQQSKGPGKAKSVRNGLLLGVSYSLIVLGGAPEAMLFGGAFIGVYLVSAFLTNRTDIKSVATFVAVAVVVAITLAAPQLLPGYGYIASSQRANLPSNYATAGPFYPQMFISLLTPFVFGSPSQILPNYQGPYTFEETLVYVGVLPLLAALVTVASLFRSRFSRGQRDDFVLHESKRFDLKPLMIAGVVSTLLSLGTYTPLESLMLNVPIYNKQRLPSRNIIGFEISIIIAAMAGFEALLLRKVSKRSVKVTSIALAVISIGLLTGIYLGGNGALYAFDGTGALNPFGAILAVSLITPLIAVAFAIVYSRSTAIKTLRISIVLMVAVDLISFDLFSYSTSGFSNSISTAKGALAREFTTLMQRERGRFAIYDPNLYYYFDEVKVGMPNLNTYDQIPSIQGYGSLSLANYEAATGSHQQATLTPTLPSTQLFSLLEGRVLLSGPLYFSYPVGDTFTTYGSALLISKAQSNTTITDSSYIGLPLLITSIQLTFGSHTVTNNVTSISKWSRIDKNVGVTTVQGTNVEASLKTETTDPLTGVVTATYSLPRPEVATKVFADEYVAASDNPNHAIAAGVTVATTDSGLYSVSGDLAKSVTPYQYSLGPKFNALTAYIAARNNVGTISPIYATDPTQQAIPYAYAIGRENFQLQRANFQGPNEIIYHIHSHAPTQLIFSLAYSSGWSAKLLDNTHQLKSLPISECYETLICITAPPTSARASIVFTYSQKGAKDGLILGVIGVIISGVGLLLTRQRRYGKGQRRANS